MFFKKNKKLKSIRVESARVFLRIPFLILYLPFCLLLFGCHLAELYFYISIANANHAGVGCPQQPGGC
jgi:hypothetical protein